MRRKVTGNTNTLGDLKTVEGVYEGSRDVQLADGGTSRVHTFRPKNDDPVEIWGFGQIDFVLPNLRGKYVWLTYKGLQKRNTKFGLRDVHTADIEADFEPGDEQVPGPAPAQRARRR